MKRIYAAFLHLYPREYRDLFGPEVLDVFAQASEEHRARGLGVWLWFLITELSSAVSSAARHWLDRLMSGQKSYPRIAGQTRGHLFNAVAEAQSRIDLNIGRMTQAIANHDFVAARSYSCEERKARADLRRLRDLGFDDDGQLTPQ